MADLDCAPPGTEIITLEDKSDQDEFQGDEALEREVLSLEINLDDGTKAKVFSRNGFNNNGLQVYNCNICKVPNLAANCLQMHINGRKHQNKFLLPVISAKLFYALAKKPPNKAADMCLAPGEPVPPGFEGEIKGVAEVQVLLDENKSPLIGLEYLVELIGGEHKEPHYICTLCDKKGDPRTVMAHLTSYNHRLWYLQLHYPSTFEALLPWKSNKEYKKVISVVVQNIVEAIESKFGRLTPFVIDRELFEANKDKYYGDARREKHFSESDGPNFVHLVTKKMFDDIKAQQEAESRSQSTSEKVSNKRSNQFHDSPEKKQCLNDKPINDDKETYDDISSISSSSLSGRSKSRSRSRSKSRTRFLHACGRGQGRDYGNDYNRRCIPQRRSRSRSYSPGRYRGRYYRRSRSRSKSRSRSPRNARMMHKPYERDLYRKPRRLWETSVGRSSTSGFERVERKLYGGVSSFPSKSQAESKRQIAPTPKELMQQASQLSNERYNLEKYRFAVEIMENEMDKLLKGHEKCPEKHPLYPDEWKKFWNRRYKELQAENKDPSKHDFKSEWIKYWTERMKQLHKAELENKRLKLREKYHIKENAEEENVTSLKEQFILKVKTNVIDPTEIIILDDDITSGRQSAASTKSENKRSSRSIKSASPWDDDDFDVKPRPSAKSVQDPGERNKSYDEWAKEYYGPNRARSTFIRELPTRNESGKDVLYPALDPSESLNVVSVLRLLTALEDLLGSLGPKVINMLSTALGMEKAKANSAEDLLLNDANNVMFETVKEKLKGQLFAGMLESHKVQPVKTAIQKIASLLHQASEKQKHNEEEERKALAQKKMEPVSVPGIGAVDKAAIAKQIAAALVAQGKPNVTTDELEQLINAVVGMANASQAANKPLTTAAYLAHLQTSNNSMITPDPAKPTTNILLPIETKAISNPEVKPNNALSSLVPQYDNIELRHEKPVDPMDGLSDSDLKTLLQNFSNLSTDEQHGLIMYLKKLESKEPERVENLRKFVNLESNEITSDHKSDKIQHSSGRASPFSNREGGTNPSAEDTAISRTFYKTNASVANVESDDDDYSYDDVFKAASENVRERQYQNEMKLIQDTIVKEREGSRPPLGTNMCIMDATSLIAKLKGSMENKINQSKQIISETSSSGFYHAEIESPINRINTGSQNSKSHLSNSFGNDQGANFSRSGNQGNMTALNLENNYFRNDRMNDAIPAVISTYEDKPSNEQFYDPTYGERFGGTASYNSPSMPGMRYENEQRYGNVEMSNAEFPSSLQQFGNVVSSSNIGQQRRFGINNPILDYAGNVQCQPQRYNQRNQFNTRGHYY